MAATSDGHKTQATLNFLKVKCYKHGLPDVPCTKVLEQLRVLMY